MSNGNEENKFDIDDTCVGITTTIPVELLFAAGLRPVDLNNIFVADAAPKKLVEEAEGRGFPQSTCAWIKGIYGAIHKYGFKRIVGVVEGDCADTGAMLEILQSEGMKIDTFAFPHSREAQDVSREVARLAAALGGKLQDAENEKKRLDEIRTIGEQIDKAAWQKGNVTSEELFLSLLTLSDFDSGRPDLYKEKLLRLLDEINGREAQSPAIRLGCLGVPPILQGLWDEFEKMGARFVFHEIPRQFAMLPTIGRPLVESYTAYTYPYDIFSRIEDIKEQVKLRELDGVVHYTQSFCHRQIHDRLLRETLNIPILTVEGDRPGSIDERTRIRIEAFTEQLGAR